MAHPVLIEYIQYIKFLNIKFCQEGIPQTLNLDNCESIKYSITPELSPSLLILNILTILIHFFA